MIALYIFAAIMILMLMITIHELGHYLAGKWLGFRINEFAIGFGPALFRWQSKKTGEIFSIRLIPLGGFCAFEGDDDAGTPGADKSQYVRGDRDQVEDDFDKLKGESSLITREREMGQGSDLSSLIDREREKTDIQFPLAKGQAFDKMPPWKRLIVLSAGAVFNFVSAILFSLILLLIVGYNQGVRVGDMFAFNHPDSAITTNLAPDRLHRDDVILAIEGTEFSLLNGFGAVLGEHLVAGEELIFTVRRGGEVIQVPVIVGLMTVLDASGNPVVIDGVIQSRPAIGVYTGIPADNPDIVPAQIVYRPMNFFAAIGQAFLFAFELAWLILGFLWQLITGQIGLSGIGGPMATITVMAESVSLGVINILILIPLISVNLAVFNLLPIPALDGARMVFVGVEWARGKPVSPAIEGRIHMIGLLVLLSLVLVADVNFWITRSRSVLELFNGWRL